MYGGRDADVCRHTGKGILKWSFKHSEVLPCVHPGHRERIYSTLWSYGHMNLSYVFYPFLLKHPSPVSRLRFYHVVLISQKDWEKRAVFKTWSGLCVVFLCYTLHSYSASPHPGA